MLIYSTPHDDHTCDASMFRSVRAGCGVLPEALSDGFGSEAEPDSHVSLPTHGTAGRVGSLLAFVRWTQHRVYLWNDGETVTD